MDLQAISVLVQSGAVGLCAMLILKDWKSNNGKLKMLMDVIVHNTAAHERSAAASNKQTEMLQSVKELILTKVR